MLSCSVMSDSLRPRGLYSPDSSVLEILQARILEWVVISSSKGSSPPRDQTLIYCVPCIAGGFFYLLSHRETPINGVRGALKESEDRELEKPRKVRTKASSRASESRKGDEPSRLRPLVG